MYVACSRKVGSTSLTCFVLSRTCAVSPSSRFFTMSNTSSPSRATRASGRAATDQDDAADDSSLQVLEHTCQAVTDLIATDEDSVAKTIDYNIKHQSLGADVVIEALSSTGWLRKGEVSEKQRAQTDGILTSIAGVLLGEASVESLPEPSRISSAAQSLHVAGFPSARKKLAALFTIHSARISKRAETAKKQDKLGGGGEDGEDGEGEAAPGQDGGEEEDEGEGDDLDDKQMQADAAEEEEAERRDTTSPELQAYVEEVEGGDDAIKDGGHDGSSESSASSSSTREDEIRDLKTEKAAQAAEHRKLVAEHRKQAAVLSAQLVESDRLTSLLAKETAKSQKQAADIKKLRKELVKQQQQPEGQVKVLAKVASVKKQSGAKPDSTATSNKSPAQAAAARKMSTKVAGKVVKHTESAAAAAVPVAATPPKAKVASAPAAASPSAGSKRKGDPEAVLDASTPSPPKKAKQANASAVSSPAALTAKSSKAKPTSAPSTPKSK